MPSDGLDYIGWNHCRECGARADVLRRDLFFKLVECRVCGEETYIPKRCATSFDEFQDRVKRLRAEGCHAE